MKLKIILICFGGLILLYGIVAKVSESNFSCSYCHEEQSNTWKVSTHKNNNCRECHIDPGVSGAVHAQTSGIKNLFIALTKGVEIKPHENPLPISTKNCTNCHGAILYINEIGFEDLPENSLKGQSLRISHRIHVEKYNVECVECHRGIVHRDPGKIGKYKTNWPLMHKDCGVCHDGRFWDRFQIEVTDLADKGKCTVCHPTYEPPPVYEGEDIY